MDKAAAREKRENARRARASAPPAIFARSMDWRRTRDAKVAKLREASSTVAPCAAATAADHIDSYHRYSMIVGEADGGTPLAPARYAALKELCAAAARDRLFTTWRHTSSGLDCVNVGPMTRCFCGHSYRAHAFYKNKSKKVHCRVPGCACPCYKYVYYRSSGAIKCGCKHALELHRCADGTPSSCRHAGCRCARFHPTVTCVCTAPADAHITVFERRSERERDGRVVGSLWEGLEDGGGAEDEVVALEHAAMSAAAGGLTSYISLAPGVERVQIAASSALPGPAHSRIQTRRRGGGGGTGTTDEEATARAVEETKDNWWCTRGGGKHDWKQWHKYVKHCRKYRCERAGCGYFKKCWTKCADIDCKGCHVIGHKRW